MNYGDSVSVQCSVPSGDLPIGIRWYFNGKDIDDPAIAITNIGKRSKALTIDAVTASHAGNYTCEASNKADIIQFSSELIINGMISVTSSQFVKHLFQFLLRSFRSASVSSR